MFKTQQVIVIGLLVLAAVGCSRNAPSVQGTNPGSSGVQQAPANAPISSGVPQAPANAPIASGGNQYPAEDVTAFVNACSNTGKTKPAICTCAMNQIQQKYTYEQFKQFAGTIDQTKQLPPEFVQIVASCVASNPT